MKIKHLGIAVDSIKERLPVWESFGLRLHHTEKVDSEGVTTAHLKVGGYEIELLEPMSKDTPVGKFIDKKGPGIHHLALEVDDIEESLVKAKKNGLEPIGEAPRPGADNTKVAFFHPKDTGGVLLEIVQTDH
jgi:methylmalonyl-CoA epimerase